MITTMSIGTAVAPNPRTSLAHLNTQGGRGLFGRELSTYEDFRAAHELYVRVFGYDDPSFALNPNLMFAIKDNGGSAVGVFTRAEKLVGFAYGFAGRDAHGNDYHYSQSAVVDPAYQGSGIGRELKYLQREVAERWGHQTMRWTFDPILARNGHFNFGTLGATGTGFLSNYYGRDETDRLVVEWSIGGSVAPHRDVRGTVPPRLTTDQWAVPVQTEHGIWVALPTDQDTAATPRVRRALADSLSALIADGMVLVDCKRVDELSAAYLAVPSATNVDSAGIERPPTPSEESA